eukprot:2533654-Amphidinium_carterae.1
MVSDTEGQQAEGPINVYQAGTLIQFASILRTRWVIGHNDVEGECNKRRAFGRHMSSVLGRSGFDATISSGAHRSSREVEQVTLLSEGQQVPAQLANSPLGIPV